mgnify:FL=1
MSPNQWRKKERWETALLRQLKNHLKYSAWQDVIAEALPPNKKRGLHLAIFLPPFLDYIVSGQKTVESRFSVTRISVIDKHPLEAEDLNLQQSADLNLSNDGENSVEDICADLVAWVRVELSNCPVGRD